MNRFLIHGYMHTDQNTGHLNPGYKSHNLYNFSDIA